MVYLKVTDRIVSKHSVITIHLGDDFLYYWEIEGFLEGHSRMPYGKFTRNEAIDVAIDYLTNLETIKTMTFELTPKHFGADKTYLEVKTSDYLKAVNLVKSSSEYEECDDYNLIKVG